MSSVNVKGKKYTVIGGGTSGIAAAQLLKRQGADVFLSEKEDTPEKRKELDVLSTYGIEWEAGQHTIDRAMSADALIVSPGISPTIPVIQTARKNYKPLHSEIEVAYWFCHSPILAVTGTNGKTTTTTLLGEILRNHGINAEVAGNIGTPFAAVVDKIPQPGAFVLEISSYQLEQISHFHAHIAILLNITPDHIERYQDMNEYAQTKFKITNNQTMNDYFIYNADDPEIVKFINDVPSRRIPLSLQEVSQQGIGIRERYIISQMNGEEESLVSCAHIAIPGEHNLYNIMACAAAARFMGVTAETIDSTIMQFRGLEHRTEFVLSLNGRSFYNDSKGTNVDATYYALRAIDSPIILIAGGRDKKSDLAPLNDLIRSKVKSLILIGEAAERMEKAWNSLVSSVIRTSSMESAVQEAWRLSEKGDAILLSPACSSFDMFRDFEERGEIFKTVIHQLAQNVEHNKSHYEKK